MLKSAKIAAVGLLIIVMFVSSLASITTLQASSKGLKLYLTVDTNLGSQNIRIYTNQYGRQIYIHDGFINTGVNQFTLNYPSRLVDNGPFQICVVTWNDGTFCGNGYNSEEKKPESVYVSLFRDFDESGRGEDDQRQNQQQTVIVCPANARCIIEQ